MEAKERDYEELLLLSHDAYHAKAVSLWWFPELNGAGDGPSGAGEPDLGPRICLRAVETRLHRFEQGVMEERNQRDKEVQEKKALVEQRVEMNKRLEMRERIQKQQQQARA